MATINEISQQALGLPESDRATLARQLLLSLERDHFDVDYEEAWIEELELRLAAVEKGRFAASDWREGLARIRKSLSPGPSS